MKLMNRVEFNEENEFHIKSRALFGDPQTPTMIRLLLKTGIIKKEKHAVAVLLIMVVIFVGATLWVLNGRDNGSDLFIGPDGTEYTSEEYFDLVDAGLDPLSPERVREFNNR